MSEKVPRIKSASVEKLVPYARNARTHSPEQVDKIAASICEFGFLNPVIIDGDNGIVAGHGRVMAARKLGMDDVPCVEASHLTEAQKRAYIIADNRLALDAGWDEELLRLELDDLTDAGFDLELTGFDVDELDVLADDGGVAGLDDEKYTTKIETPIYEPKGDQPAVGDLYDTSKADELAETIKGSNLPDDVRSFLLAAAARHVVFDYEKIAEFYAHQPANVQSLMEGSALVIVDFDRAIEHGYVVLTEAIRRFSGENG